MIDEKECQQGGLAPMPDRWLFYGDNLDNLRRSVRDESVDLCYIDPPFNSKRNWNQIYSEDDDPALAQAFVDMWKWDELARAGFSEILSNSTGRFTPQLVELIRGLHRVLGEVSLFAYVVGMSLRAVEIRRALKPSGSFFLHCDAAASHYLKLALDAIFGLSNFKNEIIWKRSSAHSDSGQGASHFGRISDTILFYAKDAAKTKWNQRYVKYDQKYIDENYHRRDPDGRLYRIDNIQGPGGKAKGNPIYEFLGVTRYWRYSRERMEELYKKGRIVQTRPGAVPQYKRYLDEMPGVPVQNVWTDISVINNRSLEALGYPTQKPEALLERILETTTDEGDLVLDAYCGCGTTVAVAERLHRRWIGIDITFQAISIILRRIADTFGQDIADSIVLNGIPRDMASAVALAHKKDDRVRKEFEKWAVLTYTNNRGVINEKKGADAGIDGRVYFLTGKTESATMAIQVKSGIVDRGDIAKLRGDMQREGAVMATLITLAKPTSAMLAEAKAAGLYHHELMDRDYNKIEIVTVQEIIEKHKRLDIPLVKGKAAPSKKTKAAQTELDLDARAKPVADVKSMREHLDSAEAADRKPLSRKGPKRAPRAQDQKKHTKD